jgi:hypothetical protein
MIFLEIEWYFERAFRRHLTRPIPTPYVTRMFFFAKRSEITFTVISELVAGRGHVIQKHSTGRAGGQLKLARAKGLSPANLQQGSGRGPSPGLPPPADLGDEVPGWDTGGALGWA